jgi:hypothetical protein
MLMLTKRKKCAQCKYVYDMIESKYCFVTNWLYV